MSIVDVDSTDYDFCSGLREYHVYRQMWKPLIGQGITFARKEKNLTVDLLCLVQPRYLEK